jgi:ABC-type polysaccharide/polyol phosphate export permease
MTGVLLVLLIPMLIIMVNSSKISPVIQEALAWTPSVLIASMLRATMAGTLWDAPLLGYVAALLGITALIYGMIGLRVRGMDR